MKLLLGIFTLSLPSHFVKFIIGRGGENTKASERGYPGFANGHQVTFSSVFLGFSRVFSGFFMVLRTVWVIVSSVFRGFSRVFSGFFLVLGTSGDFF